jgi:hypothetical protein
VKGGTFMEEIYEALLITLSPAEALELMRDAFENDDPMQFIADKALDNMVCPKCFCRNIN